MIFTPSADASKLSSTVKDQIPGQAKELKKDGEAAASEAKSKVNQLSRDAKDELSKVDNQLEQYRKDAANTLDKTAKDVQVNTNKAIDNFDKNVSEVSGYDSFLICWKGMCWDIKQGKYAAHLHRRRFTSMD